MTKNWEVALTQSNSSNSKESESNLNNITERSNRGVDLILNGGKKKQAHPLDFRFEQIVCFFKREVAIAFQFSLDIKKKR